MEKIIKKHIMLFHVILLILIALLMVLLITWNSRILGFGGDWYLQSVSFYEYFRDLFYETGDLFPDLALHIGGGQNIYYLSYYGLYSPYLVLFYFLPFVKAGDFLMIMGFLNVIISSALLYIFLEKNNYSKNMSFYGALLLLVSTGFMCFNFSFVMFVQYFPFLLLALIGTKKYLDTNKSTLLIVSIVLVITTNYFFSISGIVCLCFYALYYYLKINNEIKFKILIRDGIKYIGKIIISIILSSFLILPVIYVVFVGRTSPVSGFDFSNLLFRINIEYLMYHSNGVGLSSVVWIAIIYNLLCMKKENKFLVLSMLLILGVPFFNSILNGFLYESGKIFIPFIPLFIILILEMLNFIGKESNKKIFLVFISSVLFSFLFVNFDSMLYKIVFYIDLVITFVIMILFVKNKKRYIYFIICIVFVITCWFIKDDISFLSVEEYNELYQKRNIDFDKYINNDVLSVYRTEFDDENVFLNYSDALSVYKTSMYSSTYNKIYKDIFYEKFNNNYRSKNMLIIDGQKNLLFQKFMGVRYLITKSDVPYGYKKIASLDSLNLYENKNVYSLGFASSNLLNYKEYNENNFINKMLLYQNNVIIDDDSKNTNYDFKYKKVNLESFKVKINDGVVISKSDEHYILRSLPYGKLVLDVDDAFKWKTLIIRFNVDNQINCNNDMFKLSVEINGVNNATTCDTFAYYNNNKTFDYVISSNDAIEELNIVFYKGIYDISDIEIYAIDNDIFDINNTSSLNIDFDKTKGDVIEGNIVLKEDGYFVFTIPYDKGYSVYVDDELVDIEQVSGGFIGFKISEGEHKIRLIFEAPYAKTGRIVSLFGIVILVLLNMYTFMKMKICAC